MRRRGDFGHLRIAFHTCSGAAWNVRAAVLCPPRSECGLASCSHQSTRQHSTIPDASLPREPPWRTLGPGYCAEPRTRSQCCEDSSFGDQKLIEDRRKVVLCRAGEHVAAIDQRESSPMITSPDGSLLGSVKCPVRVPAQAAVRERVRCVEDALENGTVSWNDRRGHDGLSSRNPRPGRECSLVNAAIDAALRHRTEPRGDRSIRRSLSQYASSAEQPNEEQHDRDDQ